MPSIKKRGEGTYSVTVSLGYAEDGKKRIRTRTFKVNPAMSRRQQEKEVRSLAYAFEEQVKKSRHVDSSVTFAGFADRWLSEHAEPNLEPKTVSVYRLMLESKILPAIGDIRLSQLQPMHITAFLKQLTLDGVRADGKPGAYSTRTIKYCHQTISTILSAAVLWEVLESNPAKKVKPPKGAAMPRKTNYFDEMQAANFLAFLENEPPKYRTLIYLTIYGGFRLEDVLPLDWTDIDFAKRTVDINKAISYVDGKQTIKSTSKNESSIRQLTVPQLVMDMLAELKEVSSGGRIFDMHYTTPRHWLRKAIKKYNDTHEDKLPEINFHGLRHTSATLLISRNVDIRTVSGRLGHKNPNTTLRVYSHFLKSRDEAASDTLEEVLAKK